jgi:DNA repair protein RadC
MTQEAFYYQVQMQEEYEMSKVKEFAEQLREEMMNDEAFRELTEENQNKFIAEEMKIYEEATK